MKATLVIFGNTLGAVEQVSNFLYTLDCVYDHLQKLEEFLDNEPSILDIPWFKYGQRSILAQDKLADDFNIFINVRGEEKLFLDKCNFNSPGLWEFIGKLNILEVLREYLKDRHSRIKDELYRNIAEQESLQLENSMKKIELYEKLVNFGKNSGLSEKEVSELAKRLITRPLSTLENYKSKEIIINAKIKTRKKDEEKV